MHEKSRPLLATHYSLFAQVPFILAAASAKSASHEHWAFAVSDTNYRPGLPDSLSAAEGPGFLARFMRHPPLDTVVDGAIWYPVLSMAKQ